MKLKIVFSILLVILAATIIANAAIAVFNTLSLPKNIAVETSERSSQSSGLVDKVQLLGDERGGGWP